MEGLFQPMHLLLILGIALLIFGPSKLAGLGKGLRRLFQGVRGLIGEGDRPAGLAVLGQHVQRGALPAHLCQ